MPGQKLHGTARSGGWGVGLGLYWDMNDEVYRTLECDTIFFLAAPAIRSQFISQGFGALVCIMNTNLNQSVCRQMGGYLSRAEAF